VSGAVAVVRYDFRMLYLDDATRLVIVLGERRQQVLPPVEFVTVDDYLPQRMSPWDLQISQAILFTLLPSVFYLLLLFIKGSTCAFLLQGAHLQ